MLESTPIVPGSPTVTGIRFGAPAQSAVTSPAPSISNGKLAASN